MKTAEASPFMHVVAAVAATGGFLYGYDTGIIAGALLAISKEFGIEHRAQEMVASAILVGATVGGLSCGWFSDRFGRKTAILIIAAVFVTGAVASSLAPGPTTLAIARIFLGLAVGGSSQAVPTYIAELAPSERRGTLVTTFNVAIGLGIMVASVVGWGLHETLSWRWMIGVAAVPATGLFIAMFWMPETPRWYALKGRPDDARNALQRVRPEGADIDEEMGDIGHLTKKAGQARTKGWKGLLAGWVRPATISGLGVAAFTQLSGIEMMIYYSPTMLAGVGFDQNGALLTNVGIAAVYLVMTATGLAIVDRVGRRRLSLLMIPGATAALIALGALFMLGKAGQGQAAWVVGCLLVYMLFNSGGLQVIGWLTGSEVYPLSVRAAGSSAQAGMVWGSDLLVTATALSLIQALGAGGAMWVYATMNVLAFAFIWKFVPEVTGHSLEDIEQALRYDRFRPAVGHHPDRELQPAA
jgi:sugar porter (SP) family MFS transporter